MNAAPLTVDELLTFMRDYSKVTRLKKLGTKVLYEDIQDIMADYSDDEYDESDFDEEGCFDAKTGKKYMGVLYDYDYRQTYESYHYFHYRDDIYFKLTETHDSYGNTYYTRLDVVAPQCAVITEYRPVSK